MTTNSLLTPPSDPYAAPDTIALPKEVFAEAMAHMWKQSYPKMPGIKSTVAPPQPSFTKVQECAYTIVVETATQVMHAYYPKCDGNDSAVRGEWTTPDPKLRVVGVMHTHPYRQETTVTSIDALDAERMLEHQGNFALVLTGSGVMYLFLRTRATTQGQSDPIEAGWLRKNFDEGSRKMQDDWGHAQDLSERYATETARHSHLAYYRGAALLLTRIWPPPGAKPPAAAPVDGKRRSRW